MSRATSAITIPLRVVILEDDESHCELMLHQLRRSGFAPSWERVETEADFVAQLARQPDVILADYRLPQMDAARALQILQESGISIPFIVVSGAIGEEVAVTMMRNGASDYVLKDRMARLGLAVRQAIDKKALRELARKTAQELRASESRFQSFMNNSPLLTRIKDAEGHLVYMNNMCQRVFGISDWYGKSESEFWQSEAAQRLWERDLAVFRTGQPSRVVEEVRLSSGRTLNLLTFRFLVHDATGRPLLGQVSADISEQVRAERALSAALGAKEVLFRELHHRVKNSLNVMSSLLRMQSQQLKDPAAKQAVADAQRRMECMALVHDRLKSTGNADEIDFREYTATLSQDVFTAYGAANRGVELRLELESITLPLTQAVPCGLILNELLTNSMKHAFPNGRTGQVRVAMTQAEGTITLEVCDNGVGVCPPPGMNERDSLGLRIVDILSRQLDGTFSFATGDGVCFVLKFPQAKPTPNVSAHAAR